MLASLIQLHLHILAAAPVKLEDVFKSTKESMNQEAGPERLFALGLGAVAVVVLLIFLQYRRRADVMTKPLNNQSRLTKEMTRTLALKDSEMRQLQQLADESSCSSPLVLLMCPSLMAKALANKTADQKKAIAPMIKKITAGEARI
jgi:hypothetical protein